MLQTASLPSPHASVTPMHIRAAGRAGIPSGMLQVFLQEVRFGLKQCLRYGLP